MRKVLMLSNGMYFAKSGDMIKEFLGDIKKVLLIPYALFDYGQIREKVEKTTLDIGVELELLSDYDDKKEAIENAEAILVNGGNTFKLLAQLYDDDIIDLLKERIENGLPYIGYSAGSNLVTPNIMTTNDMPIARVPTFDALGIVPFNLNPHYHDLGEKSVGESRDQRLNEFLKLNDNYIVGLPEFTYLLVEEDKMIFDGENDAPDLKLFEQNKEPTFYEKGSDVSFLLTKK